jgi:Na+/melibiose symporter-like transporter
MVDRHGDFTDNYSSTLTNIKVWISNNRQQLSYGLSGFAASLLTTQFALFNVALFTTVVHLHPNYFYLGHIIYALWNAINDPAFGWIIDKTGTRLEIIQYGGPIWASIFLLTWFPWSYDGNSSLAFFHFLFSMFCFDGFLTFVMIVKCALLADLCVSSRERNQLNAFSAWFALAGSSIAMCTWYVWDVHNLNPFRMCSVVLCCLSACAWYLSGKTMVMPSSNPRTAAAAAAAASSTTPSSIDLEEQNALIKVKVKDDDDNIKDDDDNMDQATTAILSTTSPSSSSSSSMTTEFNEWWKFVKQLIHQDSFRLYVSLNWFQNFNYFLVSFRFRFHEEPVPNMVLYHFNTEEYS